VSKVILKGHIIVPDHELEIIKKELVTHIKLTRLEAGCLIFEITQSEDNPNRFDVYEEFTNKNSFDEHQNRVSKSKWGEISKNIERHYQIIDATQ
jgi:(4S)-4-hydroxy-5-phosphonooxypentane-2,3-dione isomerase